MNDYLKFLMGVLLVWVVYRLYRVIRSDDTLANQFGDILQSLPRVALVFVGLTMIWFAQFQSMDHMRELRVYSGKSTAKRHWLIHGQPYLAAQTFREHAQGYYKSQLLSDMDFTGDTTAMTYHRKFAYFLYPEFDVRGVSPRRQQQAIVAIHKANAGAHIPEGYKIVHQMNDGILLAVKEGQP